MAEAPIFRAASEGNEGEVNRLLDENPALLKTEGSLMKDWPLMRAAHFGQLGVVRLLVERRGADINAKDFFKRTALYYAAQAGHVGVVIFFLSQGAEANRRSRIMGMTPFMLAAEAGHLGVMRSLLQHIGGQVLHERDDNDTTALHHAAFEGHEEVVRFLLFAGADPTVTDKEGRTPRTLAKRRRRASCVAVFEWWDGELKRRALLHRAISLHKAYTTQRDMPTSQVPTYLRVPTYLEARVVAGHAVPGVEVVSPQSGDDEEEEAVENDRKETAGERGDAQGAEAGEEERHAMLEFVLKGLNEQLVTELLEGFHGPS